MAKRSDQTADLMRELRAHGLDLSPEAVIRLFIRALERQRNNLSDQPRSHLSGRERALYEEGGFDCTERKWEDGGPRARALAAYSALVHDGLSVAEAAHLLRVSPSTIRHRLKARALYSFRSGHRWVLPEFQFDSQQPLPHLKAVLRAMESSLHPLTVAQFFVTPQPDLVVGVGCRPISPRQWLLGGFPAGVVASLAGDLSSN